MKKVFTNQVQLLLIDGENVSIDKDKAYSFVSDICECFGLSVVCSPHTPNPSADKIMDICMVLEVTPEQLLTGKGIDEDYVEYKLSKVITEPEISKADIRIIEDIHAMKDAQRKRLMKYMEALKQIEALEDME